LIKARPAAPRPRMFFPLGRCCSTPRPRAKAKAKTQAQIELGSREEKPRKGRPPKQAKKDAQGGRPALRACQYAKNLSPDCGRRRRASRRVGSVLATSRRTGLRANSWCRGAIGWAAARPGRTGCGRWTDGREAAGRQRRTTRFFGATERAVAIGRGASRSAGSCGLRRLRKTR